MSIGLQQWITAGHVFGFTVWVGAMITTLIALQVHGALTEGQGTGALQGVEKRTGMLMDLGATIAIVAGIVLLVGLEPSPDAVRCVPRSTLSRSSGRPAR